MFSVDCEDLIEIHQGKQFPPQAVDGSAVNPLDTGFDGLAVEPHQLQKIHLRNGESFGGGGDNQGRNNCQCEGDLDLDRGAVIDTALQIDCAANLVDVGFDDVHADTAARYLGDLGSR